MTLTKIWTTTGLQKQTDCLLEGSDFSIKYIAVGDGKGSVPTPSADDTALVNEVWRGEISEITNNAPQFTAITYIPEDEGDFVIRELGVFDEDNNLLFVSQMDETPKYSSDTSGLVKEIGLKVVFELQNGLSAVVVDPSTVIASVDYVDERTETILNELSSGGYADTSLSNLVQTGENKLNYNVCCANSGDTNDDGTPAFIENVESSTITSSYSSSGVSNFAVDTSVYFDDADYNDYIFTYDGENWLLDDEAADLADYGITFDEKFTVSEYYTSDTVTSVSINSSTFLSTVENTAGTYTFTSTVTSEDVTTEDDDGETTTETVTATVWTLDDVEVDLSDYGITVEGEITDGDTITVTVTSLLAEDDTITVIVAQTFTLTTSGEFVVTTAYGKSYTITDTLTLDISDLDDGEYNLFVDPVENTLSALSNTITADITFPDDANDGDYLLNTAKIPYDLQKINITEEETTDDDGETTTTTTTTITTGLNEVYIGTLTITGGGGSLNLNNYNKNLCLLSEEENLSATVEALESAIEEAADAVNDYSYTTSYSKSSSGYYKLDNGLIAQWGRSSSVSYDASSSITLPTSFSSSTSYKVIPTTYNTSSESMTTYITAQSASSFTTRVVRCDSNSSGTRYIQWIAAGY